jgi:hypothetical protein
LRWRDPVGRGAWLPLETGTSAIVDTIEGWTPEPTTAPGHVSESHLDYELRRRAASASFNSWEDDKTCGWYAGTSCEF